MYAFSPSLMCMDLLAFREQIDFLNGVADCYHVDIMDGHFVPNLTLSPYFVQEVKKAATLPVEAHLMVTDPGLILPLCLKAGADLVCLHAETLDARAFRLIDQLRAGGCRVGIAFNPETGPEAARYYLGLVDKVTVMTVDPGFAGQKLIRPCLKKLEAFRELREKEGYTYTVEVDGCCNAGTFRDLAQAGAETFILGSGLFGLDPQLPKAWDRFRADFEAATAGLA